MHYFCSVFTTLIIPLTDEEILELLSKLSWVTLGDKGQADQICLILNLAFLKLRYN